ncbi:MAG TPA: putative metal-dependent hydrolase, partial [Longimicrobiaceae bacterium]|nr:putative metal-dependent hydrolase [Longimicrobiaceae bacterium]
PVGRFDVRAPVPAEQIPGWTRQIADTPARLRAAVEGLSPEQLDTPYRPGGWTVRQLVHHLPDSHMNAYTRLKLALTEDEPTIKPYDEAAWALLEDSRSTPPEVSLTLLETLHDRWVRLMRALGPADFARTLRHPEMGTMRVDALVGLYAWHGRHHVAHITGLRERMGWT